MPARLRRMAPHTHVVLQLCALSADLPFVNIQVRMVSVGADQPPRPNTSVLCWEQEQLLQAWVSRV
eukprot:1696043-Amphidinium_carterae.2